MHDVRLREAAATLIAAGISDGEAARRLGIPRTTVRDWRRRPAVQTVCPRCWRPTRPLRLSAADYAHLLGLYLGDGHVCALARAERLRIFLDARYALVVDETEALLQRGFPGNRVSRCLRHEGAMVVLSVYHRHLSCLLPQHGPGKKHERSIVLEAWQEAVVAAAPWEFLKGCIRSDGCVFVNRTGRYAYLTYDFANRSEDIRELFARVCGDVGVECRVAGDRVRINRRASVALMREHVGLKA